jgi:hypothetical protein
MAWSDGAREPEPLRGVARYDRTVGSGDDRDGRYRAMRLPVTLGALAALALSVSACGSGAKSASTGPGANQPTTTAARVPQTSSAPSTSTSTPTTGTAPPARTGTTGKATPRAGSTSTGTSSTPARRQRSPGDNSIQAYGQQATSAETQAVSSTVARYYAALASGDGASACALLSARLSDSLVRGLGRSPALRAKGCPGIIALLFKHRSGQSNSSLTGVQVTSVRIKGGRAFALLRSKSIPTGEIPMVREGGQWKVGGLIGGSL